jgi:hypothetical protein
MGFISTYLGQNGGVQYWLVVSIPLKNMKVSWDDEIPNTWKVIKFMFQTTNQNRIF